jgi:hypothetical protein
VAHHFERFGDDQDFTVMFVIVMILLGLLAVAILLVVRPMSTEEHTPAPDKGIDPYAISTTDPAPVRDSEDSLGYDDARRSGIHLLQGRGDSLSGN